MLQILALSLMLLPAFLSRLNLVVEGADAVVTPATSGSRQTSCKEFTFSVEDFKNAKSDEDLLNIWRSKMVDVEYFVRETLLAQTGEININTAFIPTNATITASIAAETSTIATNDALLPTRITTNIAETNNITSNGITTPIATSIESIANDVTSPTLVGTSMGGTSTITSSDASSPTLFATTVVQETVITPDQCEFNVSGICYWSYVNFTNLLNFTEARQICTDKGSVLAYFPTELAYSKSMDSIRAKIKSKNRNDVNAFTGVMIDIQTRPDTEVYMKWLPSYPKSCKDYTSVSLHIKSSSNSNHQGMWNLFPSGNQHGVVCQNNLN